MNVFTKLPVGSTQIQTVAPTQTLQDVQKGPQKLNCAQCSRHIAFKPELLQIKVTCVCVLTGLMTTDLSISVDVKGERDTEERNVR